MPTHRSTRRRRQAAATRHDILLAARRLFAERGFAATSIAEVAAEADVAVQTIYTSVGSKRDLVIALNDLIDEDAEVPRLAGELGRAGEPAELLRLAVRLTRTLSERCGDITRLMAEAAPGEPDVAAALAEGHARHRAGTRRVAAQLDRVRSLQDGLTVDRAAAVLATLTAPETYAQLVDEHEWSYDQAEKWLVGTLGTLLLAAPE